MSAVDGIAPVCHACAAEQIHRIPDAVLRDEAVQKCGRNHGDAAGDAALDPGEDGIGFDRQVGAVCLPEQRSFRPAVRVVSIDIVFDDHRDIFMDFVRQDLTEPSHAPKTMRHAAKTEIARLVTSPANSRVNPKARTIGHAVGAGR